MKRGRQFGHRSGALKFIEVSSEFQKFDEFNDLLGQRSKFALKGLVESNEN